MVRRWAAPASRSFSSWPGPPPWLPCSRTSPGPRARGRGPGALEEDVWRLPAWPAVQVGPQTGIRLVKWTCKFQKAYIKKCKFYFQRVDMSVVIKKINVPSPCNFFQKSMSVNQSLSRSLLPPSKKNEKRKKNGKKKIYKKLHKFFSFPFFALKLQSAHA